MAIKMNLMFTNQIMMAFTLNDFEVRYPVNDDLVRQKLANYLKNCVQFTACHITYSLLHAVQYAHYPDCMVNRMCAVRTLKDLNTSTYTNKKETRLATIPPPRNSAC